VIFIPAGAKREHFYFQMGRNWDKLADDNLKGMYFGGCRG
jgi:hypothetical protein